MMMIISKMVWNINGEFGWPRLIILYLPPYTSFQAGDVLVKYSSNVTLTTAEEEVTFELCHKIHLAIS